MKLIDRYIFFRVLGAMLGVLLAIVSIDLIGGFVDQIDNLENQFTLMEALLYAVLKIPGGLKDYLGFSALIGAMIGLGSFSNSGELTVIRASGYSMARIGWMVMRPAFLLIVFGALVAEFVAPNLEQMAESRRDLLRGKLTTDIEESGLWIYDKGTYVHMDAVYPGGEVYGLHQYTLSDDGKGLEASFAEEARYDQEGWDQSENMWSRISQESVDIGANAQTSWATELTPDLLDASVLEPDQMSIRTLSEYSTYLGNNTKKSREYQVQFWSKLLQPITVMALVFVGISFVMGSSRQVAVGERIFFGVIVGVSFKVAQDILGPAAVIWGFSPLIAVLAPAILIMLVGLFLLRLKA